LNFGNNIVLQDKYIDTEKKIASKVQEYKSRDGSSGKGILIFVGAIILLFILPKVIKIYSEKIADKIDNSISKQKDNKNDK
jgi:hypothetical protein